MTPRTMFATVLCAVALPSSCAGGQPGGPPAAPPDAARYARCMRAHGVPAFPDPVAGRILVRPGTGIDPASPAFRAAEAACAGMSPRRVPPPAGRTPGPGLPTRWAQVPAWVEGRARAGAFSGVVAVAVNGRTVVDVAAGRASAPGVVPLTPASQFDVASVGKMLTAAAVARLVEQGRVDPNAPVGTYVAGLPAAIGEGVTVRQLLTHTSGLGDVFAPPAVGGRGFDLAAAVARIGAETPAFAPGTAFRSSNSGYVLLGAVLESTGRPWQAAIRDLVLRPAGMSHTSWSVRPSARPPATGAGAPPPNPSGGVTTTAGDLVRFARALAPGGTLRPLLGLMTARTVPTDIPGRRYGWGIERERRAGVWVLGHGGGAPGREAQVRIVPARGVVTVVVANTSDGARPVSDALVSIAARLAGG